MDKAESERSDLTTLSPEAIPKEILNIEELSEYLGVCRRTS